MNVLLKLTLLLTLLSHPLMVLSQNKIELTNGEKLFGYQVLYYGEPINYKEFLHLSESIPEAHHHMKKVKRLKGGAIGLEVISGIFFSMGGAAFVENEWYIPEQYLIGAGLLVVSGVFMVLTLPFHAGARKQTMRAVEDYNNSINSPLPTARRTLNFRAGFMSGGIGIALQF